MRIFLRPVTVDDSNMIAKWRNSPNVRNHCFSKRLITEETNKIFFHQFVETGKYKQFIVNRIDDDFGVVSYPIASVYLKDIDLDNLRCELCVFTSDDEEWNSESQICAIDMLVDKAFNEYGIRKIYSYVFKRNNDEVALLKNAGFVEESILYREAIDLEGNEADIVRLCVFKK